MPDPELQPQMTLDELGRLLKGGIVNRISDVLGAPADLLQAINATPQGQMLIRETPPPPGGWDPENLPLSRMGTEQWRPRVERTMFPSSEDVASRIMAAQAAQIGPRERLARVLAAWR